MLTKDEKKLIELEFHALYETRIIDTYEFNKLLRKLFPKIVRNEEFDYSPEFSRLKDEVKDFLRSEVGYSQCNYCGEFCDSTDNKNFNFVCSSCE